jgi:5'-methylthioadenosine phosphorylase
MPEQSDHAEIGVIGGSGLYSFVTGAHAVEVTTPFGSPSEQPVVGAVNGRSVAFIPRHGLDHRLHPQLVNYRANLWALRAVGVRQVLAPNAVGSLRVELGPGTVVVPDQVVDRTWGRSHTLYDAEGGVVHVPMADPYCPHGRAAVMVAAEDQPGDRLDVVDGGTLVVVNGPRFSTRAESRWHAAAGWSLVGMTGMPEAAIARELALCYTSVALVTDLDAGVESGQGVTQAEVLEVFGRNVERLRTLLAATVARLPQADRDDPDGPDCSCRRALDGLRLPFDLP